MERLNWAARIARYFLTSKLTPTLVVAIVALGLFAIFATPREENPQIVRPAAIIVTRYPGADAQEVQRSVTERGERVLREVPGIEHVYATSTQDTSYLTVLFHVGDDPTKAFVDLYDQVFAHLAICRPEPSQPVIVPMSTDDIPIVVLTLHGARYDRGQLGDAAQRLIASIQRFARRLERRRLRRPPARRSRSISIPCGSTPTGFRPLQIARAHRRDGRRRARRPAADRRQRAERADAARRSSTRGDVAATIVGVHDGLPVALARRRKRSRDHRAARDGVASTALR